MNNLFVLQTYIYIYNMYKFQILNFNSALDLTWLVSRILKGIFVQILYLTFAGELSYKQK